MPELSETDRVGSHDSDAQPWASECPDVKIANDGLTRSGTGCISSLTTTLIFNSFAMKALETDVSAQNKFILCSSVHALGKKSNEPICAKITRITAVQNIRKCRI